MTCALKRSFLNIRFLILQAPGFGDDSKNTLHDMAESTGSLIFGDEGSDLKIKAVQLHDLGQVSSGFILF